MLRCRKIMKPFLALCAVCALLGVSLPIFAADEGPGVVTKSASPHEITTFRAATFMQIGAMQEFGYDFLIAIRTNSTKFTVVLKPTPGPKAEPGALLIEGRVVIWLLKSDGGTGTKPTRIATWSPVIGSNPHGADQVYEFADINPTEVIGVVVKIGTNLKSFSTQTIGPQ